MNSVTNTLKVTSVLNSYDRFMNTEPDMLRSRYALYSNES